MEGNILFNKRVRRKRKSFFNSFMFCPYFKSERISFKEKVYTFYYNLHRHGETTVMESEWSLRTKREMRDVWDKTEKEFFEDYKNYLLSI